MSFEAIQKSSAVNLVVNQIVKAIDQKTYIPGSKLPSQRDLAIKLGVGRSSIREACNILITKGYLETIQGKGTFIKDDLPTATHSLAKLSSAVQVSSIYNLMEARALLECKSAALAAKRAKTSDLKKLDEILDNVLSDQNDYGLFLEYDIQFHTTIAEATQNEVICEMTKLVLSKLAEHHSKINTDDLSVAYKKEAIATAMEVIRAIKEQQEEKAAEWMARHISVIENEIGRIL